VSSQEIRQRVDRRLEESYVRHLTLHDEEIAGYYGSGPGYYKPDLAEAEKKPFSNCLAYGRRGLSSRRPRPAVRPAISISKMFVLGVALEAHGRERVLAQVGVEPSGDAFNSIVFDERNNRPFNPMVNAGALATAALVEDAAEPALERILDAFRRSTTRCSRTDT
jgi:glutaminase